MRMAILCLGLVLPGAVACEQANGEQLRSPEPKPEQELRQAKKNPKQDEEQKRQEHQAQEPEKKQKQRQDREREGRAAGSGGDQPCRAHAECASGVCSRYKKDNGFCAPVDCRPGQRADNNHFFCNRQGEWERSRPAGAACERDGQCFEPTCFMDPMCDARPRVEAVCRKGECVHRTLPDGCTGPERRKVLHPDEYQVDAAGNCMQSLAQRVLRTVCVPCGNGRCDPLESHCNCAEDCPRP